MSATDSIAILGRPIAFYPNIARAFGDINTAVIISQFMYWRSKVGGREIYKTREEIEQETSVSQDTQRRIFNKLKKDGLVKITKRGVPAKNYYLWDFKAIDELISQANSQNQQFAGTRTSNLQEQEPAKSMDKNQQFAGANTETTAKTTTEITTYTDAQSALPVIDQPKQAKTKKQKPTANDLFNEFKNHWPLIAQCDDEILHAWCQVRIEKKAIHTELAHKAIEHELSILIHHGLTVTQAIREAAANGWKGLKSTWYDVVKYAGNAKPVDNYRTAAGAIERLNDTSWAE